MTALGPALGIGFVYALIALSLNAVFSSSKVINLAQGEFVVLGGLLGWWFVERLEVPYLLAFLLVALLMIPAGLIMERMIMLPVKLSGSPVSWVIATVAAVIVFSNLMALPFDRDVKILRPLVDGTALVLGGSRITWQVVIIAVTATTLTCAYAVFLNRTTAGHATRAVAFKPDIAALVGIDAAAVVRWSFIGSAVMAGLAGLLLAPEFLITSQSGLQFTTKGLVALVLGGIGSAGGAVLGGLIVGILDTLVRNAFPSSLGNLVVYALLVIVLLIRPSGLFGRPTEVS